MERVDLERHAFFVEAMSDDLRNQLLLELRDIREPDADARVLETVKSFARERQVVSVWQLYLHPKFIADIDILFPTGKTASDRDLLQARLLFFAELVKDPRRYIERKPNMLSLVDGHFVPVTKS